MSLAWVIGISALLPSRPIKMLLENENIILARGK
jgi:hypothetical protein